MHSGFYLPSTSAFHLDSPYSFNIIISKSGSCHCSGCGHLCHLSSVGAPCHPKSSLMLPCFIQRLSVLLNGATLNRSWQGGLCTVEKDLTEQLEPPGPQTCICSSDLRKRLQWILSSVWLGIFSHWGWRWLVLFFFTHHGQRWIWLCRLSTVYLSPNLVPTENQS